MLYKYFKISIFSFTQKLLYKRSVCVCRYDEKTNRFVFQVIIGKSVKYEFVRIGCIATDLPDLL